MLILKRFLIYSIIYTMVNKNMKGGNKAGFLEPQPITETPLQYGATNPAEEAFLANEAMSNEQNQIMNGEAPQQPQTGGNADISVPQYNDQLSSQPGGTNDTITQLTKIQAQQGADATMDGCVGQGAGCTNDNYWDGKGGKRKMSRKAKKAKKAKKMSRKMKKSRKLNTKKSRKLNTKKSNKTKKSRKSRK
jgi:hypothetical protein